MEEVRRREKGGWKARTWRRYICKKRERRMERGEGRMEREDMEEVRRGKEEWRERTWRR